MRWLFLLTVFAVSAWSMPVQAADAGHADGHGHHIGEDVSAETRDPSQFKGDLAVWTLIVFVLLFLALKATAWPKISTALDEREAGIRNAIADAEKARVAAAEMLKEHQAKLDSVQEEVKAILAEARRDAERTKNDIVASANTEATTIRNRAIADIERARNQALNEVFDKLADQVAAATAQVVGRTVTQDDQSRFIHEALAQVSAN